LSDNYFKAFKASLGSCWLSHKSTSSRSQITWCKIILLGSNYEVKWYTHVTKGEGSTSFLFASFEIKKTRQSFYTIVVSTPKFKCSKTTQSNNYHVNWLQISITYVAFALDMSPHIRLSPFESTCIQKISLTRTLAFS
jgi:hypothetical protein